MECSRWRRSAASLPAKNRLHRDTALKKCPCGARYSPRSPGTRISGECVSTILRGIWKPSKASSSMHAPATRRDLLKWSVTTLMLAQSEETNAAGGRTALLIDPGYKQHDTGPGHPERPERYDAVTQAFTKAGLTKSLLHVAPRAATEDEIALCHTRPYIQTAKRDIASGARELSTGDTTISSKSWGVALDAAGGLMNAVDAVFERRAVNAFAAVRPPGHHARPNQGMGFCIFNNVAIAARYAQRKHGVQRVLIADWDVQIGRA